MKRWLLRVSVVLCALAVVALGACGVWRKFYNSTPQHIANRDKATRKTDKKILDHHWLNSFLVSGGKIAVDIDRKIVTLTTKGKKTVLEGEHIKGLVNNVINSSGSEDLFKKDLRAYTVIIPAIASIDREITGKL